MNHTRLVLRRLVRTASWHRRLLAAGLAAAAVALAIEAATPAEPELAPVIVAAHDLEGGATVTDDDLTTARLPPDAVPAGAVPRDAVVGRVLTGPVRAGEPMTDRRVLGPSLVAGWGSGLVASPVRVGDSDAVSYLRPGDRIDVLATPMDGLGVTTLVAAGVPVLAVPPEPDGAASASPDGALLMVAVTPEQAADLAGAAITSRLSFTFGGSSKPA